MENENQNVFKNQRVTRKIHTVRDLYLVTWLDDGNELVLGLDLFISVTSSAVYTGCSKDSSKEPSSNESDALIISTFPSNTFRNVYKISYFIYNFEVVGNGFVSQFKIFRS